MKDTAALDLLMMSWSFAMRVGDARRVRVDRIQFAELEEKDTTRISLTIVDGKSVRYTGPYTVIEEVNNEVAKRLLERRRLAVARGADTLFNEESQRLLSSCVSTLRVEGLGDYSLRSIRKGRIQYLSSIGATGPELLSLTQHRSLNTLRRYLGWGATRRGSSEVGSRTSG